MGGDKQTFPHTHDSQLYCAAHLGMFYLQLSHLYEVLPEGHNTPALETGEFYEDNVQLKKGAHRFLHTKKQVQTKPASLMYRQTNLSSQTLRACQISAGTAAGAPLPGGYPCSSVEPYPKPC